MKIDAMPSNISQIDLKLERFSQVNTKSVENVASIKKLAEEFEGIFMEIVLKSMREATQESGLTSGGSGGQVFQSMLDSEYAKSMSANASTGLATNIQEHLLRMMIEGKK